MRFCVITSVPDADKDGIGNLAVAMPLYVEVEQPSQENGYAGRVVSAFEQFGATALSFRSPVFALGEILVLDESGREVGGAARKPGKWSVGAEEFDTVEEAAARSRAVVEG